MNARQFNILLICAILVSLLALWSHKILPSKRLAVLTDLKSNTHLYSSRLQDGSNAAIWIDQQQNHWQCISPERLRDTTFVCSFIIELSTEGKGVDLSGFTHLALDITYQGPSNKIRFYTRNFNIRYSNLEDTNSNKFNAVNIDTAELKNRLIIPVSELHVADWWLLQYNIPRADSYMDMENVIGMSVDFESNLAPGIHDVTIHNIEFIGQWISAEQWYLSILIIWLAGIFLYALNQLNLMKKQTNEKNKWIVQLDKQNRALLQQSNEFRRLSTIDPLTQAFNRFGVHQIIDSLHEQQKSREFIYSLILLDIDFFKQINDLHGHDTGDKVLQTVSDIIQQRIRKTDYLGRWGGEEFLIVLPHTQKEFAIALAEKIRLVINDTVFDSSLSLRATASFGIAQQRKNEEFLSTLKRADNMLYAAKSQGRNCCMMAPD